MLVRVDEVLERMGGVATRSALLGACQRAAVDRALRTGEILAIARGRYAVTAVGEAVSAAHRVSGVLSLTSAALHHGWEVKTVPGRPHVTVPRKRRPLQSQARDVSLHYSDLLPEHVAEGIATSAELTVEQCLRRLPDDEALAIADSALRHGVPPATLRRIAASVNGPGAAKVRRLAAAARGEAANPFESVLRSIASTVPGLAVEPQRLIVLASGWVRPDLVDTDLRIVVEADSFERHGGRAARARSVLVDSVRLVTKPAQPPGPRCGPA